MLPGDLTTNHIILEVAVSGTSSSDEQYIALLFKLEVDDADVHLNEVSHYQRSELWP